MFLNTTSCSKCRHFVHQSLNEHLKNLSVVLIVSQQLNLGINTTFLGKSEFLKLFESYCFSPIWLYGY